MKPLFKRIRQNAPYILLFALIAVFYYRFGCPIRFFTGICCPGCGMTRAVFELLRLDFASAFKMHPLVFLLPLAIAIYFSRNHISKKAVTALCLFALLLLTVTYIVRLTGQSEIVYADFEKGLIYKLYKQFF